MHTDVPNVDLLTWTFGNQAVREEDTCYIDSKNISKNLTKGAVRQLVRQLIAGFNHIKQQQQQQFVVCLHSFNDTYYPALFLAVIGAGGQFTGSNPAYTVRELAHHLRISKTDLLITQSKHLDNAVQAAKEAGISQDRIFVFDSPNGAPTHNFPSWTTLLQYGQADWLSFNDKYRSETTTAVLASTSGTTGLPKMAARSHMSFVAEHYAITRETRKPYRVMRLLSVPIFHAFAAPLALLSAIRDGAPTIILPRFDKAEFLRLLPQYQITETAVVPPLLLAFLSYTPEEKAALKSLKLAWCGGAPLDLVTQNKACQLFAPAARIVQVWGMTECGWISTFPFPENDVSGSVGRIMPSYEVKLIDDNGSRINNPAHRPGEILVRGSSLMQHYIGNVAATRETIDADGWLHTGDVATIKDGKIYVVDRKKELIKVRGWQVAPAELEGVLLTHPLIADAAVIGVSHSDAPTEIPRAYVVKNTDVTATSSLSPADVKMFLLQHLAKYKVGDCEIRFCESIPKSMSGKILRKLLREGVERESMVEANPARASEVDMRSVPGVQETDVVVVSEKTGLLVEEKRMKTEETGLGSVRDGDGCFTSAVMVLLIWIQWIWAELLRLFN